MKTSRYVTQSAVVLRRSLDCATGLGLHADEGSRTSTSCSTETQRRDDGTATLYLDKELREQLFKEERDCISSNGNRQMHLQSHRLILDGPSKSEARCCFD